MATTTAQHSLLSVPPALAKLFSFFPLKTYPPLKPAKVPIINPLLWIHPPRLSVPSKESVLSADVECLKWQAHIALRGLRNISVRWDVSQDGAINARLPNLQAPSERTKDPAVGALDDLEGYKDIDSRDESHAWIALLEGDVHAALAMAQPLPSFFYHTVLQLPPSTAQRPVETILTPPPAPLSGFSSPYPPTCLGHHEWFLGSLGPTALDAAAFAYLHVLLHAEDDLRIEVARRVNLFIGNNTDPFLPLREFPS
ncbi:hypothetical protein BGY98DRAFT_1106782 [Russula aff. rugulosa BPL654]|nr:hypothetical protein BGY98DRAFT_1106782 [Russula aff. rugulosa BPL654]